MRGKTPEEELEVINPTRLELWCEKWWRDHGWEVRLIRRELAFSRYELTGHNGRSQYVVPLVPVQGSDNFRRDFESYWERKAS